MKTNKVIYEVLQFMSAFTAVFAKIQILAPWHITRVTLSATTQDIQ